MPSSGKKEEGDKERSKKKKVLSHNGVWKFYSLLFLARSFQGHVPEPKQHLNIKKRFSFEASESIVEFLHLFFTAFRRSILSKCHLRSLWFPNAPGSIQLYWKTAALWFQEDLFKLWSMSSHVWICLNWISLCIHPPAKETQYDLRWTYSFKYLSGYKIVTYSTSNTL